MNTANLQLEGLYIALAALTEHLTSSGMIGKDEVDRILGRAEASVMSDPGGASRSHANLEAIRFPIRFLRHANGSDRANLTFSEIAREIGASEAH